MQNLRPGGVFVAVDYDMGGARALPEVELYSRVRDWLKAGFEYAHADPFVGMRLPVLFGQAGYDDVGSLGLQAYWPPESRQAAGYVVGVVRAMKEAIVGSGVKPRTRWVLTRSSNGSVMPSALPARCIQCRRSWAGGGGAHDGHGFRSRTCCNVG